MTKTELKKTVNDVFNYYNDIYEGYKLGWCSCKYEEIEDKCISQCEGCANRDMDEVECARMNTLLKKPLTKKEYKKIYKFLVRVWNRAKWYDEEVRDNYGCECVIEDGEVIEECEPCARLDDIDMEYTFAIRGIEDILKEKVVKKKVDKKKTVSKRK